MTVYFNKFKGIDRNFITVGIKNPDIALVHILTEEDFLKMVDQVKNNPAAFVIPLELHTYCDHDKGYCAKNRDE